MTRLAGPEAVYGAVRSALTLSCYRTHGPEVTARAELEAVRREHAVILSGWPASPGTVHPALYCGQIHQAVDGQARARPLLYVGEDGRVWLCYRPPHWFGHGLYAPSAALAALDPAVGEAWYRGHQSVTAARFGGPSAAFVQTHAMADGDPLDAGYFIAGGSLIGDAGRYVRERGTALPDVPELAGEPAPVSPAPVRTWTAAGAVRLRTTVLQEALGTVGATQVVEHAWRIVLGAYWEWLPGAFGLTGVAGPLDAARLYAALIGHDSVGTELEELPGAVLVHHTPQPAGAADPLPPFAAQAIVRAWSAVLPNFEWQLRAATQCRPARRLAPTVRFDRQGPEG